LGGKNSKLKEIFLAMINNDTAQAYKVLLL